MIVTRAVEAPTPNNVRFWAIVRTLCEKVITRKSLILKGKVALL